MVSGQRVLMIDGLSETEQVLKAVLEPRGLRVDRIRGRVDSGPCAAPPNVLVLHEDESPPARGWDGVPRVVIGAAQVPETAAPGQSQYLPHPFQYRELIQAIERLLAPRGSREPAA